MPSEAEVLPKLKPREQSFVNYYCGADDGIAFLNATQAYIKAGYSAKYANTHAHKMLQNAAIHAHVESYFEAQGLSRNITMALVGKSVRQTDAEILEVAATLGPASVASYISSKISERNTQTTNAMKAHGVFTENINVTGGIDINIVGVDTEKL